MGGIMKKIILVLLCFLLLLGSSCGREISDSKEYQIRDRRLNNDNTYRYSYRVYNKISVMRSVYTDKKFNVGDTFTISLNRVDGVYEKTNTED
jgi:hypothetical protein